MTIKFTPSDRGNPPGKLADAELHWTDGPLAGLKLIDFGVWQQRNSKTRTVTFPARQYSVNGERRSFSLLRPIETDDGRARLERLILEAWDQYDTQPANVNETNATTDQETTPDKTTDSLF